jgi:hypothetical protein
LSKIFQRASAGKRIALASARPAHARQQPRAICQSPRIHAAAAHVGAVGRGKVLEELTSLSEPERA